MLILINVFVFRKYTLSKGNWVSCHKWLKIIKISERIIRQMWQIINNWEIWVKGKLRRWRLLLPVWTTSIFIAFENAIMSVISTDYTTFFFIVCIHRHGMMELQLMSRNEFLLCLIKTEQKEKKFLLLAAHLHGAPCSQSGLYHLHAGFCVAHVVRTTRGPHRCLWNC